MPDNDHNRLVADISELKVDVAEMRRDMAHLTETIQTLQRTLEATTPRREMLEIEARFEKRVVAMETSFSGRLSPLETKVDTVIATIAAATNKGSGAMWAVNIFWVVAFALFGIYMQLRTK